MRAPTPPPSVPIIQLSPTDLQYPLISLPPPPRFLTPPPIRPPTPLFTPLTPCQLLFHRLEITLTIHYSIIYTYCPTQIALTGFSKMGYKTCTEKSFYFLHSQFTSYGLQILPLYNKWLYCNTVYLYKGMPHKIEIEISDLLKSFSKVPIRKTKPCALDWPFLTS